MNKNTRNLRNNLRAARRVGAAELVSQVPVGNYHSNPSTHPQTTPICRMGKGGVVSQNAAKNLCMKVLHNKSDVRGMASATFHEPIDKDKPITFRNHAYMEYRNPRSFAVAG
jgi:hypothetical protein